MRGAFFEYVALYYLVIALIVLGTKENDSSRVAAATIGLFCGVQK